MGHAQIEIGGGGRFFGFLTAVCGLRGFLSYKTARQLLKIDLLS